MKERLQVHQDGVFTTGQKVLEVEVRCLQYIEDGQILALPLIEANHFLVGFARPGLRKFHPAMRVVIQDLQSAELRISAFLVRPPDQVLKMNVHSHGPGFVNQLRSVLESRHNHRSAVAMRVSSAGSGLRQNTCIGTKMEQHCNLLPVPGQMRQELTAEAQPVINTADDPAREYGIFRQKLQSDPRPFQPLREIGEPLSRSCPSQPPFEPGDVQLQYQSFLNQAQELQRQVRAQDA